MRSRFQNFRAGRQVIFIQKPKFLAGCRKGQTAIEFVIITMAVLFLFVGFLYFIQGKIADSQYEAISVAVKEVALTIQDEINLAQSSANGYFRSFILPANLNGKAYQANIIENSIYVKTDDGKHAIALHVANITGNVLIGSNTVYKINSTVYLN